MRAAWSELGMAVPTMTSSRAKLSEVKAGTTCTVVALDAGRTDGLRRLLALGILPGAELQVLQAWPGVVFRMGFGEFAIDAALASTIDVLQR